MEIYNFRPTSQVEWQKIQFHHLRNQLFSVIFLVLGCHQLAPIERPTCDVPVVSTGQVRTREMLCSTDVLPRGDGNRGDWLLENQHLSVTVRNRDGALTDIQAFGGSAIDVSYGGADDVWIELLPVFSQPPRTLQLLPHNDSLEIIGENQRPVVRYKMNPDEAKLHISGPSEWILTPTIGSQVYGQVIAPHNANFVYYINGEIAQLDRGLQLTNPTSIVFTDWSTVYQNQDEQATWIEGEATGQG